MIQRVQSIWLLLAALCAAALFMVDIFRADAAVPGMAAYHIRVNDHFPSMLIALVLVALPFIAIFMFKNRKQQRLMAVLTIVLTIAFLALSLMRVTNLEAKTIPAITGGTYWIGAVLPVVSLIFLILAIRGINKDEKLVRAADRLR